LACDGQSTGNLEEETMNLEIDKNDRDLLAGLVERRISELHPEIRRSMDHTYKDKLKEDLNCLEAILERLKSLE
jgi:hypothetical protein